MNTSKSSVAEKHNIVMDKKKASIPFNESVCLDSIWLWSYMRTPRYYVTKFYNYVFWGVY